MHFGYLLAGTICRNDAFISGVVAPMLFTGASVMVFMLALAYMSAQFFRKPEHESFVSLELHQLLLTLFLFATIFGSTCLASELSYQLAGKDPIEIGRDYLEYVSSDVALPAVEMLYATLLNAQYWGSWTARWGAGAWGTIIPMFPGLVVVERVVDFLLVLISPFAASLLVQAAILETIRGTLLQFILPAGIVLRLFPQTRDASAFLLATALGFGIVFPYTYVMHDSIVRTMIEQVEGTHVLVSAMTPALMQQELLKQGIILESDNARKLTEMTAASGTIRIAAKDGRQINIKYEKGGFSAYDAPISIDERIRKDGNGTFASFASSNGFFDFWDLFRPLRLISIILLQALFLPALSMTITIAFIKGFTKFINQKMN